MTVEVSPVRRAEIIDALRRGTVPARGLDVMAVGLGRFAGAVDEELDKVAAGGAVFKAVRGEWGSGKTFALALDRRTGSPEGFRHLRAPDIRNGDAASPSPDRLPASDRTVVGR